MIALQSSGHCDVINNRLWRHQQNENGVSDTVTMCKIIVLSSFMDLLCHVRNKIMHVLSWRTVSALTQVLFLCLFPSLLRNLGNKHKNNTLVSAETVRHSSTYIILYITQGVIHRQWGSHIANGASLKNMGKWLILIYRNWLYNHNKAKLGTYFMGRTVL